MTAVFWLGDRVQFIDFDGRIPRIGIVEGVGAGDDVDQYRIKYVDYRGRVQLNWFHADELTKLRALWRWRG